MALRFKISKIVTIETIPVLVIVFDIMRGFVSGGIGSIESLLLLSFILYFLIRRKGVLGFNVWIPVFAIYTLLFGLYSSDTVRTFQNYVWVVTSLFMAPIAFVSVRTLENFDRLNWSTVWLIILFVVNGLVTAALGIGENPYGGDFVMGAFIFATLYSGSIALMLLPVILPRIRNKWWVYTIIFFALILFGLLILSLRRTAILIPLLGYGVYYFFSSYKKQIAIGGLAFFALLAVSFPLYSSILMDQLAARDNVFNSGYNLEEEYRYLETLIVFEERYANSVPWKTTLFGNEVFNSYGNYNEGLWGDRPLHIDYNKLIWETGLVGLGIYLAIFISLSITFFRIQKYTPPDPYYLELKGMFWALFIVVFLISTQGGMFIVAFRAMIFIYLGAILGILDQCCIDSGNQQPAINTMYYGKTY